MPVFMYTIGFPSCIPWGFISFPWYIATNITIFSIPFWQNITYSLSLFFRIVEILTVAPKGVSLSGLLYSLDGSDQKLYYRRVSWTPASSQVGLHFFCFNAVDSSGWVRWMYVCPYVWNMTQVHNIFEGLYILSYMDTFICEFTDTCSNKWLRNLAFHSSL